MKLRRPVRLILVGFVAAALVSLVLAIMRLVIWLMFELPVDRLRPMFPKVHNWHNVPMWVVWINVVIRDHGFHAIVFLIALFFLVRWLQRRKNNYHRKITHIAYTMGRNDQYLGRKWPTGVIRQFCAR